MNTLVHFFQVDYALIASQAGATLNNLLSHAQELVSKLRSLQLDQREFVCLKFLVLFSLGEFRRRGGDVGYGLCTSSKSHLVLAKVLKGPWDKPGDGTVCMIRTSL